MLYNLKLFSIFVDVFEEDDGKLIHLTNNSVQKKHPNYSKLKEETIWTMARFEEYLLTTKKIKSQIEINEIYHKIKEIITYVMQASADKLTKKTGFYELLGCDFMLDENFKPYLLEMNTNPALFTGNSLKYL